MSAYRQILMQYETALPDDQTMDEVRNRAVSIAPKFDEYPGLNFKLYGVNERSEAAVNEYSSIYLWPDLESMRGFLEGDLFDNYSRIFARPSVRSWLIHEITGDRAALKEGRSCLRQIIPLPRQTKIGEFLKSWNSFFSFLAIMEADRPIHIVIAFSGEEEKLDTARRFLPLVSDNRLHDISLWFFVLGQNGGGSVAGF
jgi:hypothetical protein